MDADVAINSFMWQNGGHSGPDHWEFEPCLQLWNGKMYLQELQNSLVKNEMSRDRGPPQKHNKIS